MWLSFGILKGKLISLSKPEIHKVYSFSYTDIFFFSFLFNKVS